MATRRIGIRIGHALLIAGGVVLAVILLWGALAYGGLPRLWTRHEHRVGGQGALTAFTAQGIPADPINLRLLGDDAAIACAFTRAGWARADGITLRSSLGIARSVVLNRADPDAPISPLYVDDRAQDQGWQLDQGRSADRRHHVRLWRHGANDWWGAASDDRGVGLSLYTLQITHRVGPNVDAEQALVGRVMAGAGGREVGRVPNRVQPGVWHRGGGGNRYRTDGMIAVWRLGGCR